MECEKIVGGEKRPDITEIFYFHSLGDFYNSACMSGVYVFFYDKETSIWDREQKV